MFQYKNPLVFFFWFKIFDGHCENFKFYFKNKRGQCLGLQIPRSRSENFFSLSTIATNTACLYHKTRQQWVQPDNPGVLAVRPEGPSLVVRIHIVGGENQLQKLSADLHMCPVHTIQKIKSLKCKERKPKPQNRPFQFCIVI